MKQTKTILKESFTTDLNTGEVVDSNSTAIRFSQEPEYVKLYLKDVAKIYDLGQSMGKQFLALLRKMNYDNQIVLSSLIKETLAIELGIKKNTLEHSLHVLIIKGILLKQASNQYLVNPHLIGKGTWKDIREIRMHITYGKDGRLVKTEFIPEDTQKSIEFPDPVSL
jgi:hypothetical protein